MLLRLVYEMYLFINLWQVLGGFSHKEFNHIQKVINTQYTRYGHQLEKLVLCLQSYI